MLDALELEPFTKLDKDLKRAATTLSDSEARYIVDSYYAIQNYRIRFGNQIRALSELGEPHELLRWMHANAEGLEKNVQRALDAYSKNHQVGQWLRSIPGIEPVLASGLLAHIDITKAPTAGHIWSFCGLNPDTPWLGKEGARTLVEEVLGPPSRSMTITEEALIAVASQAHRQVETVRKLATQDNGNITRTSLIAGLAKRPWNADLKKLNYLIGESFIKVQANKHDIYGKIYAERKSLEQEANEWGMYAEQAKEALQKKHYSKDTEAYKWYSQGKLPPAHIHARARRYAVKVFLSHLQAVWYEIHYERKPPMPYVIEHLGHVHYLQPPNWPMETKDVATEEELVESEDYRAIGWEDETEGEETVTAGQETPQQQALRTQYPKLATKLARWKEQVENRRQQEREPL